LQILEENLLQPLRLHRRFKQPRPKNVQHRCRDENDKKIRQIRTATLPHENQTGWRGRRSHRLCGEHRKEEKQRIKNILRLQQTGKDQTTTLDSRQITPLQKIRHQGRRHAQNRQTESQSEGNHRINGRGKGIK
jgi:hypothetical protein